jgi:hypothetical protein
MKRFKYRGPQRTRFVWGTILILVFGFIILTMHSTQASKTGTGEMNLAPQTQNVATPAIPPIDKNVAPIIETASFGLG